MNPLLRAGYVAVVQAASAIAQVTPPGGGKVRRSLAARRGLVDRWLRWARVSRATSRPLVWVHAPSVGEGLQARPVLQLLQARHPDWQLVYSFFSPSAESLGAGLLVARGGPVDFSDFLPFDTPGAMRALLAALRPSVLVFSKLDLWPVLCAEAKSAGVPTALVSGTMSPGSSRGGGMAGALLRDAYRGLASVGAVATDDAERLISLGVVPGRVTVTGDTRYDQVWERTTRLDRSSGVVAALTSHRPTLVAGSTWPSDEAVLLPAWLKLRETHPSARLIIAPHEPTPAHNEPIVQWAASAGLGLARIRDANASAADVVLVDTVGMLGDLYALGTAAFVGGGFHDAGLHSVLEPAAYGAPVCFGPRHHNARDAAILIAARGGAQVDSMGSLVTVLTAWLDDPQHMAGARAREVVEGGLGAAERSAALVERLVRA